MGNIENLKIIYKSVEDLIPYADNPRKNDKAVDLVAESIQQVGFKNPIITDGDGVIIAGHTRLKAARKLGMKMVPVDQSNPTGFVWISQFCLVRILFHLTLIDASILVSF